jgi:hypothetical protein
VVAFFARKTGATFSQNALKGKNVMEDLIDADEILKHVTKNSRIKELQEYLARQKQDAEQASMQEDYSFQ